MSGRSLWVLGLVAAWWPGAFGCNALTGANELRADRLGKQAEGGDEEDDSGGAGASVVNRTISSGGGQTGAGGAPPAQTVAVYDAVGVQVHEVAIYQGIKRTLGTDGTEVASDIPVVAGRSALLRVFAGLDASYNGAPVTAQLYLGDDGPLETSLALSGPSTEENPNSTFNFLIPGDRIVPSLKYRVALVQAAQTSVAQAAAHFPANDFATLPSQSAGNTLKIVLVPVIYGADGSNRLPDTSPAQLQRYEQVIYSLYPIPKVEISVRAAVSWNTDVTAYGSGWSELLDALANLRQSDNVANDVYYHGVFSPDSSYSSFCEGGCIAGLGMIGSPTDDYARVAIGLGFSGVESAETAAHEIGHTHGREHAPCGGAQNIDPTYPYSDGRVGAWGYNLITNTLVAPDSAFDMMAYCEPIFVSDYTYKALFDRLKFVNSAKMTYPSASLNVEYERLRIHPDGSLQWLSPAVFRFPPSSHPTKVTLSIGAAKQVAEAQFYPYDHLGGGLVVWPKTAAQVSSVSVIVSGKQKSLHR